jgi:serine protease Do
VEGISFAIPANTAWDIAKQLIDKGYVSGRPDIGASLSQVQYGYNIFGTSYYQVVVKDPRGVKELKVDDIIVSVDNQQISTLSDLAEIVASHKIGDIVTLTVVRDRRYVDVKVTLVEYQPAPLSKK